MRTVRTADRATQFSRFITLIEQIAAAVEGLPLHELAQHCIEVSGLLEFHTRERGERGLARKENLEELIAACRQFSGEVVLPLDDAGVVRDGPVSQLDEFLDQAALESGEHQSDDDGNCVQLMTLHTAKGLEFPIVFMAGMEEGLFPHRMSRRRTRSYGGRATALLRRHHARDASADVHVRRDASPARHRLVQPTVAIHRAKFRARCCRKSACAAPWRVRTNRAAAIS